MAVETRIAAKSAVRSRPLAETLAYVPGSASRILMLLGLLVVGAALPVAASFGMKTALDALPASDQTMFLRGLVVLVVAFATAAVISALSIKLRAAVLETIAVNQRRRIAETALSLPLMESDRLERGDVVSRLTADVNEASKLVTNLYLTADIALKAASAAAYMLVLNREVGLLVLACSIAVVGAARLTNRAIPARMKTYQGALGALSAGALNILEGRTVIKAFLAAERMEQAFDARAAAVAGAGRRLARQIAVATLWSVLFVFLSLVAVFGYGGYMVAAGRLSFGGILAILHLCDYFGPLSLLGDRLAQVQKSTGALERVQEFTARQRPLAANATGTGRDHTTEHPNGPALLAEHVSFGYDEAKPVLKDVSLTIARGSRVAVMGRSGSGKSSLLKVLAGIYQPTSGTVSINGTPVDLGADAGAAAGAAQAVYQPQEPFVFPGSIRDNLLLADEDASADELLTALATADAAEFVTGLSAGLDSEAGERGGSLSGGQRQRLALARTLLTQRPVLLLDEPTSSLDRESEARVLASLARLPDLTLIMVTHRFQTAEVCDQIIVMDDGVIAESGSHTELLARQGLYWTLYTGGSADSPSDRKACEQRGDIA